MTFSPTPPPDGLDSGEDQRIRQVVDIFASRHPPIPGYDRDDLYQEARIAWLLKREDYDAACASSRGTFIRVVVESRLTDIVRFTRAARRAASHSALSLDRPLDDEGGTFADVLADGSPGPADEAAQGELSERLRRIRDQLRPRQRVVLDALKEERPRAQIAREMGISRDTLYEEIRRIREACRDAGLEEFLS